MVADSGPGLLLIRADAGADIGIGHAMRCLALAQAWRDSAGGVVLASAGMPDAVRRRYQGEDARMVSLDVEPGSDTDARQTAALASGSGARWIVADGYRFRSQWQESARPTDARLLLLDDCGDLGPYRADLVLNQNIHADDGLYAERAPYTRMLLGTRYALLRREFATPAPPKEPHSTKRVLITLGGSDPGNITERVVAALARCCIPSLEARVVVGPASRHLESVRRAAESVARPVTVLAGADDMRAQMEWADVAISAAGSTCWELACMGVPNLTIVLADNQRGIAAGLEARGVSVNLGWHSDVKPDSITAALDGILADKERLRSMSAAGRDLVDGHGARRVVEAMTGFTGA